MVSKKSFFSPFCFAAWFPGFRPVMVGLLGLHWSEWGRGGFGHRINRAVTFLFVNKELGIEVKGEKVEFGS